MVSSKLVYCEWMLVYPFGLCGCRGLKGNCDCRYGYCMFLCWGMVLYKACPSESGTEVGAPLFPAVELRDFSGRWQCMSGEIWYTLDSGSVLLTETEAR